MWEAHGVPWEAYAQRHAIADEIVCERFCAECACSLRGTAADPCWNCGSETTPTRPLFWPVCGGPQSVIGGHSFGPEELEDP